VIYILKLSSLRTTAATTLDTAALDRDKDGGWQWPRTQLGDILVQRYRITTDWYRPCVPTKHPLSRSQRRRQAQKSTDSFEAALIDIDNVACIGGLSSVHSCGI